MEKEKRVIVYDELNIEAYHLLGFVQPFPLHFHNFFVIGCVDDGFRYLQCQNKEYHLCANDIVLFNPNDTHTCAQINNCSLDYRAINIPISSMEQFMLELTGKKEIPSFQQTVIQNDAVLFYLRCLHKMMMEGNKEFEKEEYLLLLLSLLIENYASTTFMEQTTSRDEVAKACQYMQDNYTKRISLQEICDYVGTSKSSLLRFFVKEKGLTPYRYLESIRINHAKTLLKEGVSIMETALQSGFCDQSHFTHYFNSFLGLTPASYQKIFMENQHGK